MENLRHRVIIYFIEAKVISRHTSSYFGQLPLNISALLCMAAAATDAGPSAHKITYSRQEICCVYYAN
jgi:hypothetical protein